MVGEVILDVVIVSFFGFMWVLVLMDFNGVNIIVVVVVLVVVEYFVLCDVRVVVFVVIGLVGSCVVCLLVWQGSYVIVVLCQLVCV